MTDKPITGVWEITMGCNMRCKHCGSSCTKPLPDELSTEEALKLCDDIAELGFQWITLSGGEPLTRPDWPQLLKRLTGNGVTTNIITNGWMCDEEAVTTAREAGIGTFAISLDGPPETHDYIRRPGSFERSANALRIMERQGVYAGIITTVCRRNLDELPRMHEVLLDLGVSSWQLQIGLPMGNFSDPKNREMLLEPEAVDRVIDFIHERSTDPRMSIYPADCLGYYSQKEIEARSRAYRSDQPVYWQGCNAGKRSLGILHNGDILGCTSIRDRSFIEGNIRKRSLKDIWYDANAFVWSRGIKKRDLGGRCQTCGYGDLCLGGCPNTRLTVNGTINSENAYCSYNLGLSKAENCLTGIEDAGRLLEIASNFVSKQEIQLADVTLRRLLAQHPNDVEALSLWGFVSYSLGNFDDAKRANEAVLSIDPQNIYAIKGLGIVLDGMGEHEQGVAVLKRAVAMAGPGDTDGLHDLAVVYIKAGRRNEARDLLADAPPAFLADNPDLCRAAGING